jgi:hypothetical protein
MNDYFIRYLLVIFQRSYAQRLVAQALGRLRYVVSILAGILKTHSNVRSRSLGQVACSHVLGKYFLFNSNSNRSILPYQASNT